MFTPEPETQDHQETQDSSEPQEPQGSQSQATPPKKPKFADPPTDVPKQLKDFLSNAVFSNKTHSCFIVYTTFEKGPMMYKRLSEKFQVQFISRHKIETECVIFLMTPSKHRVSAILNFTSKFCTVSFVLVRGVLQDLACYTRLTYEPFEVVEQSLEGGLQPEHFGQDDVTKAVNWKLVQDFAVGIMCEDVHLIFGFYLEFSKDVTACQKCLKGDKLHTKYHLDHKDNAKLFVECRNQKAICQQAADAVTAFKRVRVSTASRNDLLLDRFKYLLEKMEDQVHSDNIDIWMAGVAWFSLLHNDIDEIISDFLRTMVQNIPKKRYFLFMGPINTGKTSLAASLLDLCGGKALNINLPFDRINFELGMAIDQFAVLFEDVKGQASHDKTLPTGQGVSNLDNLRDHLDGSVKVNLERKHVNKKTQVFPPGIVTMNEYYLPKTLFVRFHRIIHFNRKSFLREALLKTPELMEMRVLHSGITLLLLLIWYSPISAFHVAIQEKIAEWKEVLDKHLSQTAYANMVIHCMNGGNILQDIREGETPDTPPPESNEPPHCQQNVTQDSGVFSESQAV